jgi:NADH-quinone oxidoreductase subunit A
VALLLPALGTAGLLYGLSWALAPRAVELEKALPYECGFSPVVGSTLAAFPVAFYLVGLLFITFDLEILLLYPFALLEGLLSPYEVAGAVLAFAAFSVGFVYEVRRGGLELAGSGR